MLEGDGKLRRLSGSGHSAEECVGWNRDVVAHEEPPKSEEDRHGFKVRLSSGQSQGRSKRKGCMIVSLDPSDDEGEEEKEKEEGYEKKEEKQQETTKQKPQDQGQEQELELEQEPVTKVSVAGAVAGQGQNDSVGHTFQDSATAAMLPAEPQRERSRSDALTSSMTSYQSSMQVVKATSSASATMGTDKVRSVGTTASFMGSASTVASSKRRRDVLRSEQLRSSEVKNLLTFEGNETLLRGSSLSVVLRNQGRVFKSSKGSASTYKLSTVVAGIDSFVSHNWTVPRKAKYLALVYHYFFVRSVIAPCVILLLIGILYMSTEAVPTVIDKAEGYEVGILARICTIPTFVVMLFFFSDLQACFGGGPTIFLDKTCIHQEDETLMQQGISKLGAFIRESKQMLTIFSDEYLRKLWTVYEVASFLTLHATEDLKMLPTSVPRLVAIMLLCMYPMQIGGFIFKMMVHSAWGQYIVTTIFAVLMMFAFRGVSREKAAISQTIANFSVKKCVCFCEDDRPVIYANIAVMMRKVLQLPEEMPEEAVLDQFDVLVRNELPQALQAQMGRYIIPMNKVFVICFLYNFPFSIDLIPSYFVDDRPLRDLLVRMFGPVTWAFADSPSMVLLWQWLAMRFLVCKNRFRERAWSVAFVVISVGCLWIRSWVNTALLNMAMKNNQGLFIYLIYFIMGFLQACWQGYGWSCRCCITRQLDDEESSSEVSNEALKTASDQQELLQKSTSASTSIELGQRPDSASPIALEFEPEPEGERGGHRAQDPPTTVAARLTTVAETEEL